MEIIRNKVIIPMILDGGDESRERSNVAKGVGLDAVKHGLELRIHRRFVVGMCVTQVFDVFGEVAEEEDVVLADFAGDFDLHDELASTTTLTFVLQDNV